MFLYFLLFYVRYMYVCVSGPGLKKDNKRFIIIIQTSEKIIDSTSISKNIKERGMKKILCYNTLSIYSGVDFKSTILLGRTGCD